MSPPQHATFYRGWGIFITQFHIKLVPSLQHWHNKMHMIYCFNLIVDGKWSNWSTWTQCSGNSIVNRNQTRSRNCTDPEPRYGGNNCTGVRIETKYCSGKRSFSIN